MPRNPLPSTRTLLVLGRASNLPTVWSNCVAGWWMGGGGGLFTLLQLCLGGTLLYLGGMYLNDAMDAAFDRQHRRERPIPSGAIDEALVWQLGSGLIAAGWLLLAVLGWDTALLATLLVVAIVVLAATLFSTFSLVIACIVKTRERFMGVGQVLTMPLFFASNAIYPTAIMPGWLQTISHLNPLTYVVDALRTCMLAGSASTFGLGHDFAVILLTTAMLVFTGARLYPRLAT